MKRFAMLRAEAPKRLLYLEKPPRFGACALVTTVREWQLIGMRFCVATAAMPVRATPLNRLAPEPTRLTAEAIGDRKVLICPATSLTATGITPQVRTHERLAT
jgi:hypothetical protein